MKIVKVTYTTTEAYAEKNKQNIESVMSHLQAAAHPGINYNVCLSPDGKTFTHMAFFKSDEDQKILFDVPAFKTFQEQLKASGPEIGPKQEFLTFVGYSKELFD